MRLEGLDLLSTEKPHTWKRHILLAHAYTIQDKVMLTLRNA